MSGEGQQDRESGPPEEVKATEPSAASSEKAPEAKPPAAGTEAGNGASSAPKSEGEEEKVASEEEEKVASEEEEKVASDGDGGAEDAAAEAKGEDGAAGSSEMAQATETSEAAEEAEAAEPESGESKEPVPSDEETTVKERPDIKLEVKIAASALGVEDTLGEEESTPPIRSSSLDDEGPTGRIRSTPPTSPHRNVLDIRARFFGLTDVGLVRDHNEDNFVTADLTSGRRDTGSVEIDDLSMGMGGMLFAVCDGMGGAAAGEVASQMAVDTIYDVLKGPEPPKDRDHFARRLVKAVEEAGNRIFSAAKMDRSRRGMGTTSTVAGLVDRVLFVGQVGDSRAYVLREGKLGLITKDQSLVNQLIEAGQLSEEEAEAFEHSNIILQALGTTEDVSVDLTFVELRKGDRLMLCSDGLCGLVHDDMIAEVLGEVEDPREATQKLVEMANNGGGHDNITVIVVDFSGEGLKEPAGDEKPCYQQYPLPPAPADELEEAPQREPSTKIQTVRPKPGADVKGDGHVAEAEVERPFRFWLIAALVLLVLLGVGVVMMGQRDSATASGDEPTPGRFVPEPGVQAREPIEAPVEVRVRTDVSGGELFVDGRSYGALSTGEDFVLELVPGAYRFEARSGGSPVATANLTVHAGQPADVLLMMPSGSMDPTGTDRPGGSGPGEGEASGIDGTEKPSPEDGAGAGTSPPASDEGPGSATAPHPGGSGGTSGGGTGPGRPAKAGGQAKKAGSGSQGTAPLPSTSAPGAEAGSGSKSGSGTAGTSDSTEAGGSDEAPPDNPF